MSITLTQARHRRAAAQGLTDSTAFPTVEEAIRHSAGLQAQELPSAMQAVQACTRGLTLEAVRHAYEDAQTITLTWAMRGTLHLLPSEDVSWHLALFGPLFISKTARRYQELGLTESIRQAATARLHDLLTVHDHLTRPDLAQRLAAHGIPVEGQAIHHLVRHAALAGVICGGPIQNGDLTYRLLESAPPTLTPDQAQAELARRYLRAFGPATFADFAQWSGLNKPQAQAGWTAIQSERIEVQLEGDSAWTLESQTSPQNPTTPTVRFLPRYDNYLLGHQSRAFMVADAFASQLHPGGGMIRACVVVDGQACATWQLESKRTGAILHIHPFESLSESIITALHQEAAELGRFLQQPLTVKLATP